MMEFDETTLGVCPNLECKHTRLLIMQECECNHFYSQALCNSCGVVGPWARTEAEAIRLWNALPRCKPSHYILEVQDSTMGAKAEIADKENKDG